MQMIRQYEGGKLRPGHWRVVARDGRRVTKLACPRCGAEGDLDAHSIRADGSVEPSVVCDCGFHDMARLDGWEPQQAVERPRP